jgi:protein gp37
VVDAWLTAVLVSGPEVKEADEQWLERIKKQIKDKDSGFRVSEPHSGAAASSCAGVCAAFGQKISLSCFMTVKS